MKNVIKNIAGTVVGLLGLVLFAITERLDRRPERTETEGRDPFFTGNYPNTW